MDYPDVGKGTIAAAAIAALRDALSTPAEYLTLMRRRKKSREDMFSESLQASAASDHEQRDYSAKMVDMER
ncbi:unnamed protein product [Caretta caretta]